MVQRTGLGVSASLHFLFEACPHPRSITVVHSRIVVVTGLVYRLAFPYCLVIVIFRPAGVALFVALPPPPNQFSWRARLRAFCRRRLGRACGACGTRTFGLLVFERRVDLMQSYYRHRVISYQ